MKSINTHRRSFIKTGLAAGASVPFLSVKKTNSPSSTSTDYTELDKALAQPVLRREFFPDPVIIEHCELLHHNGNYMVRVRSADGAEGYCVGHNIRMPHLYPIQLMLVNPYFVGKDARDLDQLIEGVFMYKNNYKYQGYTLWIPVATVEMAILDMLGRIAQKSMGQLIGDIHNAEIAIYRANNNRGKSAEESIESIKELQAETNAKAVKFKIGGRRSNPEMPAGRTERLIPLMREAFGDDMTIYADCNGSYGAPEAIRIGKLLQAHRIDLFEQPVPTDWYEDWKRTADALEIPIASGGGEVSLRNFRWLIGNEAVQMVQQDLFYFGGMIRCMKVARMAATKGYSCVPHISGTGLGYVYMMQFVSALPNAGPYHEFKGLSTDVPFECKTSSLKPEDGILHLPTGIGSGVEIDPAFIAQHKVMKV
ncbi:mandelate racemase/muconate lactonizing enzyme family protein [Tunicatimonas pelagia]|uniref:mandelate racemase/muconate lactonizing enzyme family protein n=1 Tax=Tunicatimonas pelagia TaxID=931531 RepID=UPI00266508CF|nr:mandelate racemase/muconate lactonizing enzyme family protein [Tunicatimonas pelagia]WKN43203.1 mandelate racemase/muconate lactonizing enzyme family protein [Tunicatimonas pelagia]